MLTGIMPGTKEYVQALENDAVVPSLLADVVRMATAFEPSKRFASAFRHGIQYVRLQEEIRRHRACDGRGYQG